MKNRYTPILFVALALTTNQVAAQNETRTDKQTDIGKLIEVTGGMNLDAVRNLWWLSIEQQTGKKMPQQFKDKLWKEFLKESRGDDLVNRLVPIYEKYLTDQDIEELIRFYESSVGRRFGAAKSKIDAEVAPVGAQWRMEILQRVSTKLLPYIQAVDLHHVEGKLDEAIVAYRKVISLCPGDPDFHLALAGALEEAGREEEAQREYREAERLRGESADNKPDCSPSPAGVRIEGNIKPPKKLKDVNPHYPDEARRARTQGTVILEAIIDVQGKVGNVRVLRSISGLDEAAIEAVKQWEYEPTLLEGTPVPIVMTVTVNFALQSEPPTQP